MIIKEVLIYEDLTLYFQQVYNSYSLSSFIGFNRSIIILVYDDQRLWTGFLIEVASIATQIHFFFE